MTARQDGALMRLWSLIRLVSDDRSMPVSVRDLAAECWIAHDLSDVPKLIEIMPPGDALDDIVAALTAAWNAG